MVGRRISTGPEAGGHRSRSPNRLRRGRQRFGSHAGITDGYNLSMSKVMVSLPDELVQRIDEEARRRSVSRSALLAAAAQRELARSDPAAVDEAIRRSEWRFRTSGSFEAADLVRRDRDRLR